MQTENFGYFQISKVAKRLDCSKDFVHQLIRDKKLAEINLRKRATRVSLASLNRFIKEHKVDPENYYE